MRTFKNALIRIVIAWVFLGVGGMTLWADGIYVPEQRVSRIPGITVQRAILAYKDGIETLVISSALDSEAQKLGWVIPLPAIPTEMAKVDPYGLKTLADHIRPKITYDLYNESLGVTNVVIFAVLSYFSFVFWRRHFAVFSTVIFLFLLFCGWLLRDRGKLRIIGFASASSVHVEKTATVGAYEMTVLTAQTSADLNAWLATNSFSTLPGAATPIIDDYIRSQWVFVAIQLTRSETGENSPHPVQLTFPTRAAIYPWKLTTLAGGSPFLELFVIGTSRAAIHGLETEYCDRFLLSVIPKEYEYLHKQWFQAQQSNVWIDQPEITSLFWNDCVLTKLSGPLDSRHVTDDLPIHWTEFRFLQQYFYTTKAARSLAWMVFVSLFGGLLICGSTLSPQRLAEPLYRRVYLQKFVPLFGATALFTAVVLYLNLPIW